MLAESALVFPVLLLFLLGMVWFGMLTYTHLVVQMAANQGARSAAAAYAEPRQLGGTTPEQQGQAIARSVLQGASLDMRSLCGIAIQTTTVEGQDAVQATVCYRYELTLPMMDQWGASSNISVVHSSAYRKEVVHGTG